MSAQAHDDPTLGLSAWNTHNASEKRLRRYLKSRVRAGDVAICLTEVWSCHPALHKIARELDLTMLAEDPGDRRDRPLPERGDTVLLLAPGFVVESWDVVVLDLRWTVVDTGLVHEPRRLIRVIGHVESRRVELLAVHGPTGANHAAVEEFLTTVADILLTTRPGTTAAAIGDWNVRLDDARRWAADHDLEVSGRGPDLAASNTDVESATGRKRGSDHHSMKHRLTLAA